MTTTRRKPKTTEPTTPPPPPAPPGASDILAGFRRRADRMAEQFEAGRAKFAAGILASPDLCSAIYWDAAPLVKMQADAQIRAIVADNLANPAYAGPTFRDRLARTARQAEHESGAIIRCQLWERNSSNAVSNALESAKINAALRAWLEIGEQCRHYLDREIVEDIAAPAPDAAPTPADED